MPNYCDYDMKIRGSKKAINRVLNCLQADYDYDKGRPAHKHFFRVFDATLSEHTHIRKVGDNVYEAYVFGYCAWSVWSCMCSGDSTYYSSVKKDYPSTFMGTTLLEQSRDCEIEVFSEEPGIGFSEHYIFKNGHCYCDDTCKIECAGYDENDKPTTDLDWDTYYGDTITKNPHRKNFYGDYAWEL